MIAIALGLVALNGFFVAAEFSLVKLRQTRIRSIAKTHGWRGRILATVHGKLDAYLSACQLGITLASLGLGWIGEPAFANILDPLFSQIGVTAPEIIHAISFAFAFFMISFLHIVIGELAPKSLAIRNPELIGLWGAVPLYGFYWLMYPLIWILNSSANLVLWMAGLSGGHGHDTHYSAEELKLILRSNKPGESYSRDEWNILAKTLDFSELEVSDLMRPIHEITALYADKTLQENLQVVTQKRFSRYPFFDKNGIDVLGIIHLKDLFCAQQSNTPLKDLQHFLRPVQYITSDTLALDLFRNFQLGTSHFAIIGQQGQQPLGFITLDNLLCAMVGEMRDEFGKSTNDWHWQDDDTLIGKGSLPIFSLERILGIDIENEELELEDEVSIGGLIMSKLREIPVEGQRIEFNQFDVVVKKMQGARTMLVQIYPKENASLTSLHG